MARPGFAPPLGSLTAGDWVVADHGGNGSSEWVGRVTRVTAKQVLVQRLALDELSRYATGSDAGSQHVLREPVVDAEGAQPMRFRWAPTQRWYQAKDGEWRLKARYTSGQVLVHRSYY